MSEGIYISTPVPVAPLFVPAHKPHLIEKATKTSADALFLDLEDAVAADEKQAARNAILTATSKTPLWVRVNDVRSSYFEEDMAYIRQCDFAENKLQGLLLPKLEAPDDIEKIFEKLGKIVPLLGFVETAKGLSQCNELLAHSHLLTVIFGNLDFALDCGAKPTREALLFARSRLIIATKSTDKPAPLDGVTADFKDEALLASDLEHATSLGFGGRLCIHPSQTAPTLAAFMPTQDEIERARAILDAAGDSLVAQLEGQMIDRPVIEQARRTLKKAGLL